jgi:hypothetical protein
MLGLVIRPEARKSLEHGIEVEWIKQLFDVEHGIILQKNFLKQNKT